MKRITLLTILILCLNCFKEYKLDITLSSAIISAYESNKENPVIDLKEVYNFEWDTLYILKEHFSTESINETIGIDYECEGGNDDIHVYIFIYKNNVVKQIFVEQYVGYFIYGHEHIDPERSIKIYANNSKYKISMTKFNTYALKHIQGNGTQ
jgi:hypothetical protein